MTVSPWRRMLSPWQRKSALVPGLLLSLLFAGCGGKTTYPVTGKVVLKGSADTRPLTGYTVNLESAEERVSAVGEVQPDGSFTLTTFQDGDGALPGKHRIAVTPPPPELDVPLPPKLIDPRYASFETSGLETTIQPGPNTLRLELDPANK